MAKPKQRDPVMRYLLAQTCLSAAVSLVFGGAVLAADVNGIRTLLLAAQPADVVIFLGSAVMILFPVVMATLIGLLAWEEPGPEPGAALWNRQRQRYVTLPANRLDGT
jgi:hypothetical protein